MSTPPDIRLEHAARLVAAERIAFAGLRVAGHAQDIIVIESEPAAADRLCAVAPALKALGFRYVTVDLRGPRDAGD
ncbi:MAG: hypothetical protein ACREMQ_13425 [Longimicrobiales bacterium]